MDLKIKDVADLLNVSEATVQCWVLDGKIPAYRLNHQYRFSRSEIENWVMNHKLGVEKGGNRSQVNPQVVFEDLTDENRIKNLGMRQFSFYRAVHRGGVRHQVFGETKEEVIRSTMKGVAKGLDLDAEVLTDLLLDRENLMPTALNNGIAVPHTRDFLLKAHFDAIVVVFPKKEIEYGSLDGEPVHTLFFLFACEDKRHLHLLAKVAHFSTCTKTLEFLRSRPSEQKLLSYIKDWESQAQLLMR